VAAALIVIEIAAPKVSESALSVLVAACSRAARDAECVLARNASDEQPAAVAIVTLQSEDKIRVEVGVRQGDHDSWRTKDFAFLAADESMDRWRAVGFAIGTLAESNPAPGQDTSERVPPPAAMPAQPPRSTPSSTTPSSTPPSSTPPSSTPPSSTPPSSTPPAAKATSAAAPAAASSASSSAKSSSSSAAAEDDGADEGASRGQERARRTQWFVGASAIFGPGLEGDAYWRVGSALGFDLAPASMPVFFTVGGSAATRLAGDSLTARWFDISLGGGVPLIGRLDASGLEFRVQALAEYFDAHASATDGASETNSRWTLGLQGAFGARLRIVPKLLLTMDVQAAGLSGETDVSVATRFIGTSASFRYLGSVGLRVRLY
jgi:hypothetical protein